MMEPTDYIAVAAECRERGFAVVPGFMPPAEVSEALSRLDEFTRNVLPLLPPTRAFFSDLDDLASVRMIDFGSSPQAAPDIDHSFFLGMSARPRYQALGAACLGEAIMTRTGDQVHRAARLLVAVAKLP